MNGVKLPRLTTSRVSKQPHRRGPSYSKQRAPIRRWLRGFGGSILCGAFIVLILPLSSLILLAARSWPAADVSSAFDLGTDESPANVRRREADVEGEHHVNKQNLGSTERADWFEAGGRVEAPGLAAYAGMVGDVALPASLSDLSLPAPLRIYVYELPSSFNTDFLQNPRCASHLFAAEVAIHRALLQSPARTLQPDEADFFFVPVYTACDFNTHNGFPNLSRAPELLRAAIELVAEKHPYWNRTSGRNHVVVASHDFGACFHAMERSAVQAGVPPFLKNSIILQTFGQTNDHPCQDVSHIQIPPYVSPPLALANWQPVEEQNRTIFAYMSGKIEVHPKESVSGDVYGRAVRTGIWKRFHRDKRFLIRRKRPAAYYEEMLHARFCLCPRGWAPWSPRIVESVLFGCIPIIIADHIKLPFDDVLGWRAMGLVLREDQVPDLATILEGLTEDRVASMQRELWRAEVRRTLLFLEPSVRGDATWQILDALAKKKMERDKTGRGHVDAVR